MREPPEPEMKRDAAEAEEAARCALVDAHTEVAATPAPAALAHAMPAGAVDDQTRADPQLRTDSAGGGPSPLERSSFSGPYHASDSYGAPALAASVLENGMWVNQRYRLIGTGPGLGPLGQGAFGEVWKALDAKFQRDVALKILQPRVCSAAALLRFELEKQVIARMEHPNIARLFDAGTFQDGRPFLAMEIIRGSTLTEYVMERGLSVRQRLELFLPICRAVHHAHERLVLHRDLKPSNILVVEHDGRPMAKVIDFGIAKIIDETDLVAAGSATLDASIKGTPAYMSPEQTRGFGDLTVRSDVYTLGVILFELLTGDTPLSHVRTGKLKFTELLTAIRDEPPLRPSAAAVRHRPATRPSALIQSRHHADDLARLLKGDLDVIVLHALEKSPARRYQSAGELAEDIERNLAARPIRARRPTLSYRTSRLLRRHRILATAAALVLVAAVAAVTVWIQSYRSVRAALGRETVAREAATAAEHVAIERKNEAERERVHAEAARKAAELNEAVARTARTQSEDLMNFMLFDLRQQLEPLGRSRLLGSVSERAEAYFAQLPPETDNDALERNRAVMYYNRGYILLAQGETAAALTALEKAYTIVERRAVTVADGRAALDLAMVALGRGIACRATDRPEDADRFLQVGLKSIESAQTADAETSRLRAALLEQLGEIQLRAGQAEAALVFFQKQDETLRSQVSTGSLDPALAQARAIACEKNAEALEQLKRPQEALARLTEELALLKPMAAEHLEDLGLRRSYAVAQEKMARVLLELRRPAEALPYAEKRLQDSELLLQVDPHRLEYRRDLAVAHDLLATVLLARNEGSPALIHARQDVELSAALASEFPLNAGFQEDLAAARVTLGKAVLCSSPSSAAAQTEAMSAFKAAGDFLQRQQQAGQISAGGQETLTQAEAALTELTRTHPVP
jgi:tRNA A-37 threonylcarbamoyl transferase component Bud32/tetratricopeptide (TPR) repeat protein